MNIDQLIENIEKVGKPTLNTLFNMPADDLRIKLSNVLKNAGFDDTSVSLQIVNEGQVHKLSINDAPAVIEFWFYGKVKVDSSGIHMKPEHSQEMTIIEFNNNFILR